ncbi:MAG: hypothetical protein HUJ76_01675 [Parasporobacterium sp.]|nr:hypothetical protein [Parasporobacterium sp.]
MNSRRKISIYVAVMTVICVMFFSDVTFADRFHESGEDCEDCVKNHLDESCWRRDGAFMTYDREGFYSMNGVDVSKWNGDIDWFALRNQGIQFAIIRVGYRGYENGEIMLDDRFYEYMDGAEAAGLETGVYFYSAAIDEEEAEEEALFVINKLAGYRVSLPVYFDTESSGSTAARTAVMATGSYTINARAFCETIEAQGYRAGVYASKNWYRNVLDINSLKDYDIWYAAYGDTPGTDVCFDMWQYTEKGELYGSSGYLDMNVRIIRESGYDRQYEEVYYPEEFCDPEY